MASYSHLYYPKTFHNLSPSLGLLTANKNTSKRQTSKILRVTLTDRRTQVFTTPGLREKQNPSRHDNLLIVAYFRVYIRLHYSLCHLGLLGGIRKGLPESS